MGDKIVCDDYSVVVDSSCYYREVSHYLNSYCNCFLSNFDFDYFVAAVAAAVVVRQEELRSTMATMMITMM